MARPTKLTSSLLAKLEEIADSGLTLKEVCHTIGVSESAWRSWEHREADGTPEHDAFLRLAARVRAGMGAATDDMAWGVLREIAEDPTLRSSDRLAAAQAILRLRTPHKHEHTGAGGGPITLTSLARLAAAEQDE
jgi:transcriptional regulator with XRE-family HTH domain